uniref:MYND-type domain-containing protein n=1 Tax=Alexandrium catenella TaxID=2925 RepID=A0A7S1SFM5_ALECA
MAQAIFAQAALANPTGRPLGSAPRAMEHKAGAPAPPCVMCLKPSTKQCSGCRAYWYCDRECQRKHWRNHKLECGRTKELQEMTPKKLFQELEEREVDFHKVTEIVKNHRETCKSKMVWLTRNGDFMREDLEDARRLPGIKDTLDDFDKNPEQHQEAALNTLFSAAEGVSRAKSLAYFQEVKEMKEQLREMARNDELQGTDTIIKCGGQQDLYPTGFPAQTPSGSQE